MSNLAGELLLRLAKAGATLLLGALVYLIAVGPLDQPASVQLALLSWLAGAAFVLLVQESPL